MPDRTAVVVSAVFASFLAGVALTTVSGSAVRAADDCIAEPKDQPPRGSHWYYHVDPVTHRKCWHQRAEGQTIHQVESSKPSPPAKPILQQSEVGFQQPAADSHTEQPIVEAQPTSAGLTGQSAPETSTDAAGAENSLQSIPSSRWPDQQSSANLNDRERGLARSAATDAEIDSQNRMPPVFTGDQVAAVERLPKISTDGMLLLVGALALTVATSRLIFKYAAARRPCRGDVLDQRGPGWEWTELSHPFSASDVSTRQADVVYELREPRELGCPTEELRQLLVQLAEYGTFSRWPPVPQSNVDPSFRYNPGDASGSLRHNQWEEARRRHVRQRASQ
jgi:hypothetical protein